MCFFWMLNYDLINLDSGSLVICLSLNVFCEFHLVWWITHTDTHTPIERCLKTSVFEKWCWNFNLWWLLIWSEACALLLPLVDNNLPSPLPGNSSLWIDDTLELHFQVYEYLLNNIMFGIEYFFCHYCSGLGLVVTSALDKTIMFWDLRMDKSLAYCKTLEAEVESMSLAGYDLMLAIGASSYAYDLRNLDRPLELKESRVDVRIRCITSAFHFKGKIREVPKFKVSLHIYWLKIITTTNMVTASYLGVDLHSGFALGSVDGRVTVEVPNTSNYADNG